MSEGIGYGDDMIVSAKFLTLHHHLQESTED